MASKKIVPILLLGTGVVAGIIALTSNNAANTNINTGVNPYQQPTNTGNFWSNFSANFTNLIESITGGVNTVTNSLKSSGNFVSTQLVNVNGVNLTALLSPAAVKNLKAGNSIKVTSTAFTGTYNVVQMGNSYGGLKDTLIVINKPYAITTTVTAGTFQEL